MKCSELIRLLLQNGWVKESQKGSHIKFLHPTKSGKLIVPSHGADEMGKGLEKKILKAAGIKK